MSNIHTIASEEMHIPGEGLLEQIVTSSDNNITIFMVIICVILIVVVLPTFRMFIKHRKSQNEDELNEKKMIIDVIKDNTRVISSLQTTLELNNNTIVDLLQRMVSTTNSTSDSITNIRINQETVLGKLEKIEHQDEHVYNHIKNTNSKLEQIIDSIDNIEKKVVNL